MTTDDDQSQDAPPTTGATVHGLPVHLPIDRLDYGDAEQLAEMTGAAGPPEEPFIVVDEPAPPRHAAPLDRARKRRDERPLPT